jgi:transcriptional regulator with XRE-family HTH domain
MELNREFSEFIASCAAHNVRFMIVGLTHMATPRSLRASTSGSGSMSSTPSASSPHRREGPAHKLTLRPEHARASEVDSNFCYSSPVTGRPEILREVMQESHTTQSELSRISGVRQPSISQFLSGRTPMSDDMLDRLLSCMGYRLEVVRRPVKPDLGRSPERSWRLHRQLSMRLTPKKLDEWRPIIQRNLDRLRGSVRGQPHLRNLDRWQRLIEEGDLPGLRRVMTGVDTDSVQMREVSPMGGLLPQHERAEVLRQAS